MRKLNTAGREISKYDATALSREKKVLDQNGAGFLRMS